MRIRKPWTEWDDGIDHRKIPGAMGIFEIADADQRTIYIGKATGKSPFGIRGELFRHFSTAERLEGLNWSHPQMGETLPSIAEGARFYRYEVNHMYYSRWIEALTRYREDHGELPPANVEDPEQPPRLGRYHWKSEDAGDGS
ncbi:MAG: hypothetical protein QF664_01695 [Dehalococcoidia bacterium]|jgi:hypothetical protein|nr:hypothetical protein [Dehalococcoidia bacterium]